VNRALQRARATLAARENDELEASFADAEMDVAQSALLARYIDAFERYDVTSLVALLHEDVVMSMPPYPLWLTGPTEVGKWFLGRGIGCKGSRVVTTQANGRFAMGTYRVDPNGGWAPWSIQIVEVRGDKIGALNSFLDTKLFELFGLPAHLS
jgi:RNA polymerase sigma-70 factor (ECF subfamily)